MKKQAGLIMLGVLFGIGLSISTPVMAEGTKTVDKIYTKLKTAITKINTLQETATNTKSDTVALVAAAVDTEADLTYVKSDVNYIKGLLNDIYKSQYYQGQLLNDIAINTYNSCLGAGISPSTCYSPEDHFIESDIFNFDVTSLGGERDMSKNPFITNETTGLLEDILKLQNQ